MRVLLFITTLAITLPAYADGPEKCTLSELHPDPVARANLASRDNLMDKLANTPKRRIRTELPTFLTSTRNGIREFNETALSPRDARFEVLATFIKSCYISELAKVIGQEGDLNNLLATDQGREFVDKLEKHIASLESQAVTDADKRACYFTQDPAAKEECWSKIGHRVLESVLLPRVLREALETSKSEMALHKGYKTPSRLEDLLLGRSQKEIARLHDVERLRSIAKDDADNGPHHFGDR